HPVLRNGENFLGPYRSDNKSFHSLLPSDCCRIFEMDIWRLLNFLNVLAIRPVGAVFWGSLEVEVPIRRERLMSLCHILVLIKIVEDIFRKKELDIIQSFPHIINLIQNEIEQSLLQVKLIYKYIHTWMYANSSCCWAHIYTYDVAMKLPFADEELWLLEQIWFTITGIGNVLGMVRALQAGCARHAYNKSRTRSYEKDIQKLGSMDEMVTAAKTVDTAIEFSHHVEARVNVFSSLLTTIPKGTEQEKALDGLHWFANMSEQ
ncbi:hypothetical protein C5167_035668, partial [Papaver somniferum]